MGNSTSNGTLIRNGENAEVVENNVPEWGKWDIPERSFINGASNESQLQSSPPASFTQLQTNKSSSPVIRMWRSEWES